MLNALMPADWLQSYSKIKKKFKNYSYTIQTLNTFKKRNAMRCNPRIITGIFSAKDWHKNKNIKLRSEKLKSVLFRF